MGLYDDLWFEGEPEDYAVDLSIFKEVFPKFTSLSQKVFQTKDLECYLVHYCIKPDGRLYEVRYEYRDLTAEEHEQYKESILKPLVKRLETPSEYIDMNYHGDVLFYFPELVARFTNGVLEWVKPYNLFKPNVFRYVE